MLYVFVDKSMKEVFMATYNKVIADRYINSLKFKLVARYFDDVEIYIEVK